MKFTVELEEFYLDEDSGDLEKELREQITSSVVSQINKQIAEKIENEIAKNVMKVVSNHLESKIEKKVTSLIEKGMIKPDRNSPEMAISEYIKKQFEENTGWRSPYEAVCNMAKKFGDELKMRYDKAFAVQVVETMRKNNLLKEDSIARLLLEQPEDNKK